MAQGGHRFQYGPTWRPPESVTIDSPKGDCMRSSAGVVSKPLYLRHARIDLQERQVSSLALKIAKSSKNNKRHTSMSKEDNLLDDLTQYRKLISRRQLSHEENLDLIRTLQKVKQMSFALKNKDKGTESKRLSSESFVKDHGTVDQSRQGSSDIYNKRRQLSARMRSNENLLDSFRADFLQGFQTNSTKSLDGFDEKECDEKSNSIAAIERSTIEGIAIEGSANDHSPLIRNGSSSTDSEDIKGYIPVGTKSICDENTSLLTTNRKLVPRDVKLRRWHSDSSVVIQSCRDQLCSEDKKQNVSKVWSYSMSSLRIGKSSENPKSSSSHFISGNSNTSSHHALIRGVSSEGCRTIDRRTERERRIRTQPSPRLDSRGIFSEDFPPVDMSITRNGFRPGTRHPYFQKNEHPLVTTSYRYGNPREFGAPLASITGTSGGSTTLQGYRVGISSREKLNRPVPQRGGRFRNGTNYSGGMEKKGYLYTDAVPGACQAFQQRLIEIANLEGDTIRYERMRKVKKKAKQDK